MENLYEKVAYLRGLADGLGVSEESKEGRLIRSIIDVLDEFADAINELDTRYCELEDVVESLDEDLEKLEDEVYEDYDDEEYDDYYDEEDEDEDLIEITCPNCKVTFYLEEDEYLNEDEIECPNCNEVIYLDELEEEYDHEEYDQDYEDDEKDEESEENGQNK
ncbi:CD1247 N-terminal domain-containing protein [Caldicellulosiruptor sp. DIB 104C]|uniref:CD1247 N-terminal domain-containing protein n=1 Tax=Caldicellulosiruptor sp. DIB 104C TaxID=3019889 RepID=UPI002306C4E6|nr:CD1247 N-terminal domain-containing protein [Caldicellulosiruptor sp. DIB 104C]